MVLHWVGWALEQFQGLREEYTMAIPRLLVVDDDPEMRAMLTQFLRKNGFIALPAATEAEIRKQIFHTS